jgi:hypothetical protein
VIDDLALDEQIDSSNARSVGVSLDCLDLFGSEIAELD